MTSTGAIVATVTLAALAVVQGLVATGKPYGRLVWGGQHETLPRRLRIGSALSIPLYAGLGWVLMVRAGLLGSPNGFVDVAVWVILGYFVIGIVMNAVSRSRAERVVMTPACGVLAACSLVIALG